MELAQTILQMAASVAIAAAAFERYRTTHGVVVPAVLLVLAMVVMRP